MINIFNSHDLWDNDDVRYIFVFAYGSKMCHPESGQFEKFYNHDINTGPIKNIDL